METRIELHAPDIRICPNCSGMNWLYLQADYVKHLGYRLVKCSRIDRHVSVIWQQDGQEIELGPVVSRA